MSSRNAAKLIQFINCRILFKGSIVREDLWIRNGKIVNPEKIFFDEKIKADIKIDCDNFLIVPGFIDVQLNGGFGYDFSSDVENFTEGLNIVAKGILQHGVTSFCPTLVTSPADVYRQVLPQVKKNTRGGKHGAQVLGAHCEGPFISPEKKGAHDINHINCHNIPSIDTIKSTYGSLENISIITVAPEIPGMLDCIPELVKQNIVVSIGHSTANLTQAEEAICKGASFITHLFNAMLPFHHRDPGIVGVLTSMRIPQQVFYGVISDGIHTHPTALRIAQRSHPGGIVLITDAIMALGLSPGVHKLGTMTLDITAKTAKILGTETLAGSICSMEQCVRNFRKGTGASLVEAIEAATIHPAQLLGITDQKGTLDYNTDADFVFLDEINMVVHATFIDGQPVYIRDGSPLAKFYNYYDD